MKEVILKFETTTRVRDFYTGDECKKKANKTNETEVYDWDFISMKDDMSSDEIVLSSIANRARMLIPVPYRKQVLIGLRQVLTRRNGYVSINNTVVIDTKLDNGLFEFDVSVIKDKINSMAMEIKETCISLSKTDDLSQVRLKVGTGVNTDSLIQVKDKHVYNTVMALRKSGRENGTITFVSADGSRESFTVQRERSMDLGNGDPVVISGRIYYIHSEDLKVGLLIEDGSEQVIRRRNKECVMVKDRRQLIKLLDAHRMNQLVEADVTPICKRVAGEDFTKAYQLNCIISLSDGGLFK